MFISLVPESLIFTIYCLLFDFFVGGLFSVCIQSLGFYSLLQLFEPHL